MQRILLFIVALFFSAMALAAVNINTATKEELEALPGIGPVKAQAIMDYRKANGPFKTIEDVKRSAASEGEYRKIKGDLGLPERRRFRPRRRPAKAAAPPRGSGRPTDEGRGIEGRNPCGSSGSPAMKAEASKAATPCRGALDCREGRTGEDRGPAARRRWPRGESGR